MQILAILPKSESFSPKTGGALAIWFHNVYAMDTFEENIKIYVVCRESKEKYMRPDSITCSSNIFFDSIYEISRNRSLKNLLEPIKFFLKNSYNRSLSALCRQHNPDIVHVHNDFESVAIIRELNPTVKIVLHMQNDHLTGNDYLVSTDYLKRAETACHIADKIVFCSDYIRRKALKTFPSILPDKTGVIFNGVELSFLASSARSLGNDFRLLFVGRIVPQKGLHLLIEAIDNVFCHFPQATLRIVGGINFGSSEEDEYLKTLKRKSEHWGDRIVWVGPIPHDQIMIEFQQADLFICPSIWNEPLGMVNAEAMACGLPIVAFAKGGIPEIVGDAGILVEETTPESLAQGINQVLGDLDLYHTLSQRGLQRVKDKFNWDTIAQDWLHELQQLLLLRKV